MLRDGESGRTGSVSQFIRLPDLNKNRLALSGLVVTKPKAVAGPASNNSDAVAVTAASQERSGAKSPPGDLPRDLQATPYIRKFPRSGLVQYGVAVYNAIADKKIGAPQITVQAEIYREGKPVYRLAPRSLEFAPGVNPKRFDYVGRLQLNDFPAGDYLLHLIVTDNLAKKKFARAEQWMDFIVR